MHTSKIPVIGLAVVGLVGCLLPWAQTFRFGETTSISGLCFADGGLSLTLFFLIGLVSAFSTRGKMLNGYYKTVAILSSIILFVTLYRITDLKEQSARMMAYGIDIKGFVRYHPLTGVFLSMSAAAAIILYMAVQLVLRYRKVIIPEAWQSPIPAGRFYLSTHHNTTL